MVSVFPRTCTKAHRLGEISVKEGYFLVEFRDVVMPGWVHSIYNQKYFPHQDDFDPQRWLETDRDELTYIFTPFSGGRSCLGQNFSLL